jgi:glycosyltransferase involved in cell wall biosynthesis
MSEADSASQGSPPGKPGDSAVPLVSFVVPCYNYAHFLGQCLDSILSQTFTDFELIVMDDCSPDNTPEVMAGYGDPRIRYVRQEKNKGGCRNLNDGLQMAHGRYVWPVSADDYLDRPDALTEYLRLFDAHPEIGFIYSKNKCWAQEKGQIISWPDLDQDRVWKAGEFLRDLLASNGVLASSILIRAECFKTSGHWDLREDIRCVPDWYLLARLALHFEVGYVCKPAAVWRVHRSSEFHGYQREQPQKLVNHTAQLRWWILDEAHEIGRKDLLPLIADVLAREYAMRLAPFSGHTAALNPVEFDAEIHAKGRNEFTRRLVARQVAASMAMAHVQACARCYALRQLDNAQAAARAAIRTNRWLIKGWIYTFLIALEKTLGVRLLPTFGRIKSCVARLKRPIR